MEHTVNWDRYLNETVSLMPALSQPGIRWNQAQRFRSLQRGDFIHPTPYANSVNEVVGGLFSVFQISYKRYIWKVGLWSEDELSYGGFNITPPTVPSVPTADVAFLLTSAQNALVDKISENLKSWDILTDIAEVGELVDMIKMFYRQTSYLVQGYLRKSPALALKAFGFNPNYVNGVGRRRRKNAPSFVSVRNLIRSSPDPASFVSQAWLAWRYGLLPVVYSTEDAIAAFSEAPVIEEKHQYHSQVTIPLMDEDSEDYYADLPYGGRIDFHQSSGYSASTRLRAKYNLKRGIWDRLGLTDWKSMLITGYEVITFSFLWDWFFDIGAALNLLHVRDMMIDSVCQMTHRSECYASVVPVKINLPSRTSWMTPPSYFTNLTWKPLVQELSGIRCKNYSFSREPFSLSLTPPNLEFGMDTLKRKLDAIALTYSLFKSSRTPGDFDRFIAQARSY